MFATTNFPLPNRAQPNNVQLYSETPLHTAASMGFDDCVILLIEHNACLEVVMGTMKMTALHLAAQGRLSPCQGSIALVTLLYIGKVSG